MLGLGLLALLLAGLTWFARARSDEAGKEPLGLFTSLPILWSETGDVGEHLRGDTPPHWARGLLKARGRITALDTLAAPGGKGPLGQVRRLVMAQPRPLSPAENVALDAWLNAGGELLLLADPALTQESAFPVGDPRRPQAVVLISPILRHWGLELEFAEGQPFGETNRAALGLQIPVNLPGRFKVFDDTACQESGEGLLVTCRIGKGRLTALADAALLEQVEDPATREKALARLLDAAFPAH